MSPARAAKGLFARLREEIRWFDLTVTLLANMGAVTLVAGALWFLFSGAALLKVTNVLRDELEITEIRTLAENNAASIVNISELLDQNSKLLMDAFPPQVAFIDYELSRIEPGCKVGEECTAFFFVRRNPRYLHCGVPAVLRHSVLDYDGVEHVADPGPRNRAQQRGANLAKVPVGFVPAFGTPSGKAFYFMVLRYDCDGETIEQQTKPIPFTLLAT